MTSWLQCVRKVLCMQVRVYLHLLSPTLQSILLHTACRQICHPQGVIASLSADEVGQRQLNSLQISGASIAIEGK